MKGNKENGFSIAGKKAIVTGGARGLCNAMARTLHDSGAEVVLIDIDETALTAAAQAMGGSKGQVQYVEGD